MIFCQLATIFPRSSFNVSMELQRKHTILAKNVFRSWFECGIPLWINSSQSWARLNANDGYNWSHLPYFVYCCLGQTRAGVDGQTTKCGENYILLENFMLPPSLILMSVTCGWYLCSKTCSGPIFHEDNRPVVGASLRRIASKQIILDSGQAYIQLEFTLTKTLPGEIIRYKRLNSCLVRSERSAFNPVPCSSSAEVSSLRMILQNLFVNTRHFSFLAPWKD